MAIGYKNPNRSVEQTLQPDTDQTENTQSPEAPFAIDARSIVYMACRLLQLGRLAHEVPDDEKVVIEAEIIALRALMQSHRKPAQLRPPLPLDAPHTYGFNQEFPGNHITPLPKISTQPAEIASVHMLLVTPEAGNPTQESFQGAA